MQREIDYGSCVAGIPLSVLIVIPARLASTRLPEKLLLDRTGKTLLQHTYESSLGSELANEIVIAADNEQIVRAATAFNAPVILTRTDHQSGTDRVAEVAAGRQGAHLLVNVQGDEPEIDARDIDLVIEALIEDQSAQMATLATPIGDAVKLQDPACVKVVFNRDRYAMYFSRSPIPFCRIGLGGFPPETTVHYQHVGLYAYRRDFLLQFTNLERPVCEIAESLEQLRALYAGAKIKVCVTPRQSQGIDTPEDYDAFVSRRLSC